MKENVVIVNCKVPSEAYQLLAMLRENPDSNGFKISHGALVKKDAGKLNMEDSFAAGSAEGYRGLTGGLIGGLVGMLAGPVGALVAGGLGALIGNSVDKEDLEDTNMALDKIGESLSDGDTAVLLLAQEQDETVLAEKLKEYQVSITRMDAAAVADEIDRKKRAAELREQVRARYGENKKITDEKYDKALAVKCVNGTFVGKKEKNVISYKGVPFVGEQPAGKNRFKKPVPFEKDEGVYEAYHFAKGSLQPESPDDAGALAVVGEDCLYLNIWKNAADIAPGLRDERKQRNTGSSSGFTEDRFREGQWRGHPGDDRLPRGRIGFSAPVASARRRGLPGCSESGNPRSDDGAAVGA